MLVFQLALFPPLDGGGTTGLVLQLRPLAHVAADQSGDVVEERLGMNLLNLSSVNISTAAPHVARKGLAWLQVWLG